jgi:hypothetical protein
MTSSSSNQYSSRLAQAKLFAEVARRVDEPFDALPDGDVSRVSLLLWQQAAAWAISASQVQADVTPPNTPPIDARELLERAAGSRELLEVMMKMVDSDLTTPDATAVGVPARAAAVATFARSLLDELERPARDALWGRLGRTVPLVVAATAVLVGLGTLVFWLVQPPDLVRKANRTLSSQYADCARGECGTAIFHTREEHNPWVLYDFGSVQQLHSIDVENRTDGGTERAVPLIVETSDDAQKWIERVRTERPFMTWSAPLSASARYVRLRVAAKSYLHLKRVVIR